MGSTLYNSEDRLTRSVVFNYAAADDTVFKQNKERKMHESMNPMDLKVRECCDSAVHPKTIPIILGLDVTGSMHDIPKELIRNGLPKMMSTLIQKGAEDASVCFVAVGDHETDSAPLQVGQFESGDAELDMWLTRTWLEGGGGANAGESYSLAWYFAARHTKTDAFDKRGKKGFLFTIGDEPNLPHFSASAIKEIFGSTSQGVSSEDILKEAQEKYNVYHLVVMHSPQAKRSVQAWKNLLGQNCVEVSDYTQVAKTISDIVLQHSDLSEVVTVKPETSPSTKPTEEIL